MRQSSKAEHEVRSASSTRLDQLEKELKEEKEKSEQLRASLKKVVSLQLQDIDKRLLEVDYVTAQERIGVVLETGTLYSEVLKRCVELGHWYAESAQYERAIELLQVALRKSTASPKDALQSLIKTKASLPPKKVQHLLQEILRAIDSNLYTEQHSRSINNMCPVHGGTFWMGSNEGDDGKLKDSVLHEVTLGNFAISEANVTVFQYALYCELTKSRSISDCLSMKQAGDHPVVRVSWYDAIEYCNWLSGQHGRDAAYLIDKESEDPDNENQHDTLKWTVEMIPSANGYRLPTEAEWEYAGRGGSIGTAVHYSKYTKYSGGDEIEEVGWCDKNSEDQTQPVKMLNPNAIGAYDMSGNVWEWCYDWYREDFYRESPKQNPICTTRGSRRLLRGGNYYSDARRCRVTPRSSYGPFHRNSSVGFRLAYSMP